MLSISARAVRREVRGRPGRPLAVPENGWLRFVVSQVPERQVRGIGIMSPYCPPGGRVQFFGEGIKKAIEFQRTGKPQKWEPNEFALRDWNIPLMPSNSEGGTMAFGERRMPDIPPKHVRVEVGLPPTVAFPIMEVRPVRLGTHESELALSDSESPLKINIVLPLGSGMAADYEREVHLTLSWEGTFGKRASEYKKMIDAIDALRRGESLRFIDIRLDQLIFASMAELSGTVDPFDSRFRATVLLASQIETSFSVPLRLPEFVTEQDAESLFYLDCLLNSRECGQVENTSLRPVKADGEECDAVEAFIKGECNATLTDTPPNYSGYFPLFSRRVATREWVRVVEFAPADVDAAVRAFSETPTGSEFRIEITATSGVFLRWRDDSNLKNIEVGALTQ